MSLFVAGAAFGSSPGRLVAVVVLAVVVLVVVLLEVVVLSRSSK